MSHINHFRKLQTTSNFDKLNWSKAPIVNIKINIMFGGSHPLLAMLDFRYLTLDFSTIFFFFLGKTLNSDVNFKREKGSGYTPSMCLGD